MCSASLWYGGCRFSYAGRADEWYGYHRAPGYYWFQSLVPTIPAPPAVEKPLPASQAWPAEARAIAESLLRRDELAKAAGVEINVESNGFDARRGTLSYRNFERLLISPKAWLKRDWSDSAQTLLHWVGRERTRHDQYGVWHWPHARRVANGPDRGTATTLPIIRSFRSKRLSQATSRKLKSKGTIAS